MIKYGERQVVPREYDGACTYNGIHYERDVCYRDSFKGDDRFLLRVPLPCPRRESDQSSVIAICIINHIFAFRYFSNDIAFQFMERLKMESSAPILKSITFNLFVLLLHNGPRTAVLNQARRAQPFAMLDR